jgi:tRNA(Arg) A34 adenosine deaminase TadA
MCLCALYWAGVQRIYYANTRADARDAGFDDDFIYNELDLPCEARSIACIRLIVEHAHDHFDKWVNDTEKIRY